MGKCLIFTDKKIDAFTLIDRDITQRLEYKDARSCHKHEYRKISIGRTYNAFTAVYKNKSGVKIVYKWRNNGFDIDQIKNADVIITDNFTTMWDLKQWLADCGIDRLVLVV